MGIRIANVFHAGDGNLHPLILFDGRESGALERAEEVAGKILQMCVDFGGSITGEHGIGVEKRELSAGHVQRGRPGCDACAALTDRSITTFQPRQGVSILIIMKPATIAELQDFTRSQSQSQGAARLAARGGGEQAGPHLLGWLQSGGNRGAIRIIRVRTARIYLQCIGGHALAEIEQALSAHGQFLPFDPPLVQAGATLGGCVASGLSGPGRYRYGGFRDFLLGVRFVGWQGQLVSSGGKVVKNAAGFDLPKLMIGSLGQYGILAELSFKVFPRPEAYATLQIAYPTLADALEALTSLTQQPFELFALDLVPRAEDAQLRVRLGGKRAPLPERVRHLQRFLESADGSLDEGESEVELWRAEVEFDWAPAGHNLVKVPLTPRRVLALDERLAAAGALRHYSVGANQAWITWPGEIATLDALLNGLNLSGLLVRGEAHNPQLGVRAGDGFARPRQAGSRSARHIPWSIRCSMIFP